MLVAHVLIVVLDFSAAPAIHGELNIFSGGTLSKKFQNLGPREI